MNTAGLADALRVLRIMQQAPRLAPLTGACHLPPGISGSMQQSPAQNFSAAGAEIASRSIVSRLVHRAGCTQHWAQRRRRQQLQSFTDLAPGQPGRGRSPRGCTFSAAAVAQEDSAAATSAARARLAADREHARQRSVAFSRVGICRSCALCARQGAACAGRVLLTPFTAHR